MGGRWGIWNPASSLKSPQRPQASYRPQAEGSGCTTAVPETASPLPPAQHRRPGQPSLGTIFPLSVPPPHSSVSHLGDPTPQASHSLMGEFIFSWRGRHMPVPGVKVVSSGPPTGPHISPESFIQSQTP